MLRRRTLERKLFGWLVALALVPALVVLAVALVLGARSLSWVGTLGPWDEVAESGRALIEAVESNASDSALSAAAGRHRAHLSESLMQASRWHYIGERLAVAAPIAVILLAILLGVLALFLARGLARDLSRPIGELAEWAGRMARGESLPLPAPAESREVEEVRALRSAMRTAAGEIAERRAQALEAERTRAWGEMARRIAHEMKNPLTPLRLAAYRLSRSVDANGAAGEAVAVIQEETERLDELARSFALLGQPAVGAPSDIDLGELLEGLLASDVPDRIARSLRIEPGTPPLRGYYDALLRSLRNLIRNAVEALGPDGGRIDVRAGGRDGGIEIVVADSGPGIPAGMSDVIFEPDRTFKPGGTGLGLAVVRQVVAAHGGTVRAQNREGGGAEFLIFLPREPVAEASPRGVTDESE